MEASLSIGDALACWQFGQEIRPGDIVVAKQGRTLILRLSRVAGSYRYEAGRDEFHHMCRVKWLLAGPWERTHEAMPPTKTLTEVTNYETFLDPIHLELATFAQLTGLNGSTETGAVADPTPLPYRFSQVTANLFMPKAKQTGLLASLQRKQNLILQGPSGVEKSFMAKRLAYLLLGEVDEARVEMVQSHPSYSYEDFIIGYCANEHSSFVREAGVLLKFVRGKTLLAPDKPQSSSLMS